MHTYAKGEESGRRRKKKKNVHLPGIREMNMGTNTSTVFHPSNKEKLNSR